MIMKKLKIINKVKSCTLCFGMGVLERPSGDTYVCPQCKGKGVVNNVHIK